MTGRRRFRVRGTVQGVGFRPFVFNLAEQLGVTGWVLNDADGVLAEAQGSPAALDAFEHGLWTQAPLHATLDAVVSEAVKAIDEPRVETGPGFEIRPGCGMRPGFEIRPSPAGTRGHAGVLPDLTTCRACVAEILDPSDRRFRYPFTNCTHCGPRFSIMDRLPYDRANTAMAAFEMCALCRDEYEHPRDRRFHAQPNACPACGPTLALRDRFNVASATGDDALRAAVALLREGQIVAVKGIGGFHLLVDATNAAAVARLRARKGRPTKPFAVMFRDEAQLDAACAPTNVERAAVSGSRAPITLMRRRAGLLAPGVAPGTPWLGALLPYTPLHHLLLRDLAVAVVATSGNVAGAPICTQGLDAMQRLGDVADVFLDHNREIRRPVEDAVVRQFEQDVCVLRRGRGMAPARVASCADVAVVAVGGARKNAVSVLRGGAVILGPHLGELDADLHAHAMHAAAMQDLPQLLGVDPLIVAHDMHPDYASTRSAHATPYRRIPVQHHHAHAATVLAERGLESACAVVWDGTGFADDGTVWGGEFLRVTRHDFERIAHLRHFRLAGGDAAIRAPARQALGLMVALDQPAALARTGPDAATEAALIRMLRSGLRAPLTSSAGRLFDAVSWLLGCVSADTSFEGEAAGALEHAADGKDVLTLQPLPVPTLTAGVLDWGPMILAILRRRHTESSGGLSALFHHALARGIADVVQQEGQLDVVLSGGCFQNRRLLETVAASLREVGHRPHWCRAIPPNDGGLAAGQAVVAASISSISSR